ncbi:hypothetical protein [Nocardia sp. NPDC060249]|uniref:hypothetical protein n=1 Tax=Nocardia sp. NPDC060249 TaxID=3347082 RepID=UPI0036686F26
MERVPDSAGVVNKVEARTLASLTVDVLDFLKPAGLHTAAAIAEELGAPVEQVDEALRMLVRSGCVSRYAGDDWDVVPVLRRNRGGDQ